MAGRGTDFGQFLHKLVAVGFHGEVSDATIQGYLRAASQLEDIWQQIDEKVNELITQGTAPWDAYARMGYALAFVRACRMNVVFVQELLKGASSSDSATTGYLPRVTHDQALALCERIEPYLEEAILALTQPQYRPTRLRLPLVLGPRVEAADQPCPLPHIMGTLAASREIREWTAGLLATYELALGSDKTLIPQSVATHLEEMKSRLKLGDFHLQTGIDMVSHISQAGQGIDRLSQEGENLLWEAMQSFYLVSQLLANPGVLAQPPSSGPGIAAHQQPQSGPVSPAASPPPAQPSPDVTAMLNQLDLAERSGRPAHPATTAPDALNQLQFTTPQDAPVHPASSRGSDLLNQLQFTSPSGAPAQPSPGKPGGAGQKPSQSKPTPREDTEDLLSEIFGEQNDTGR